MHQVLERIQSLLDLALEASAIQDCWPSEVHAWQEVHDAGEMYSEACHMAEVEFAALMARI